MEGALDLSKSAAKEGAQRLASAAGKKLIEKALTPGAPRSLTPKSLSIIRKYTHPNHIVKKAHGDMGAKNINSLFDGSGHSQSNAIAIQDLVRNLNGSGMKVA